MSVLSTSASSSVCYVTKCTYTTACEPGDHSRVTRRTYATAREYISRARAHWLTCLELSTGWSVFKRTDVHLRREPKRPVVSWYAGGRAISRFIWAIRWTWFNTGPEWTSGGSSSAGIWKRVVCSRIVEDVCTVCRFWRPEGSSIDGGHVSRAASGHRIAWSASVERRPVWDRRLAVKDDWASSDFLLSRLVEFILCITSGTFILPWFFYADWTLLYFMLLWFCTINLMFSFCK